MSAMIHVLKCVDKAKGDVSDVFPASMTVLIWPATTKGRTLRKLVLDYYSSTVPASLVEGHIEEYPPEFVQDLMLKGLRIHQNAELNVNPTQIGYGFYHEDDARDSPDHHDSTAHHAPTSTTAIEVLLVDKEVKMLKAQVTWQNTPMYYINLIRLKLGCDDWSSIRVNIKVASSVRESIQMRKWETPFADLSTCAIIKLWSVANGEKLDCHGIRPH